MLMLMLLLNDVHEDGEVLEESREQHIYPSTSSKRKGATRKVNNRTKYQFCDFLVAKRVQRGSDVPARFWRDQQKSACQELKQYCVWLNKRWR
jgi:hypothetical protein